MFVISRRGGGLRRVGISQKHGPIPRSPSLPSRAFVHLTQTKANTTSSTRLILVGFKNRIPRNCETINISRMSSEAAPISPARFAAALKDLPLSTLHLKAAELRNSIAHLDYSNEELKPFAEGTDPSTNGEPDHICIDAIKENEVVIARLQERIELLKAEVESRGSSVRMFPYQLSFCPAELIIRFAMFSF